MYFYEVLAAGNRDIIIEEFFKLFGENEQVDIEQTKIKLIGAMETMSKTEPNLSDMILFIEEIKDEEDDYVYDDVYAAYENDDLKYAFEYNLWADTLGYLVDNESLEKYGTDRFAAIVVWEMTWAGYDEESIRKEIESWEDNNYSGKF